MRALLAITLGLNALLAGLLWRAPATAGSGSIAPRVRTGEAAVPLGTVAVVNPRVIPVEGDDGLPWPALAAGKFRDAMKRLRAAGCPEETIRDIIIGAVSRRYYALLMAEEEERFRNFKWWRGIQDPDADYHPGISQALRRRRDAELLDLLGPDWRREMHKTIGWPGMDASMDTWISPEKREQMQLLEAKYAQLENDVRRGARGGYLLEEEEAQLKSLKTQKRAELAQLLTPSELDELNMRQSPAANWARQRLPEAASEDEFRKMVRAALAAEKDSTTEDSLLGGESPQEAATRRAEEEKKFQEQLKAELGDARYAELFKGAAPGKEPELTEEEQAERSRKAMVKLAQKEGVSADAANEAHTRMIALLKGLEAKFGDLGKLPPEQQRDFEKTIKGEAQKIFTETMGEKGAAVFKRLNHEE